MERKYRHEIKYICTEQELKLIESRIGTMLKRDPHVGPSGIYTIRSVYFDDYDNTCFYESEDGVNSREKFRIRTYNGDTEHITLECKQKLNGKNHKDSCPLTKEQCRAILEGTLCWEQVRQTVAYKDERKVFHKFFSDYSTRFLRAKVIVSYERTPFVCETGNVRITFDRNISGSSQVGRFLDREIIKCPVMPPGQHILEVKYDELLPDYLYNAMQIGSLKQTAYSKYVICRQFCG
ncbi:MAG: polyphosphate polymerase domain-containing protein [Lachnospiraceae bacterium]|nr:polyphosphate polymerase domain-containing protein [Lachnospiraceae bacterium]